MEKETYVPKKDEPISITASNMISLAIETHATVVTNFNGIKLEAFSWSEVHSIEEDYCWNYLQLIGAIRHTSMPANADKKKADALMGIIERIIAKHLQGLNTLDNPSFQLFELAKRVMWSEDETTLQEVLNDLKEFNK